MSIDDLPLVEGWLRQAHVARWWLAGTTADDELGEIRACVVDGAESATRMLMVLERGEGGSVSPVGWCQWYPYDAYPVEGAAAGVEDVLLGTEPGHVPIT